MQAVPLISLIAGTALGGFQTIKAADAAGDANKQEEAILAQAKREKKDAEMEAENIATRDQASSLQRIRRGGMLGRQGTILTKPLGLSGRAGLSPNLGGGGY